MKETKLKLRIYGDKALRKKSLPLKSAGPAERELLSDMAQFMYAAGGVGLAAPQIGINKRLIVVDVGKGLNKFINPRIKQKQGACFLVEGCLSVPEVTVNVKRAKRVLVEALDECNNKVCVWADELFARALQHEIDHLDGKLIVDYAGILRKIAISKKFRDKLRSKRQQKK